MGLFWFLLELFCKICWHGCLKGRGHCCLRQPSFLSDNFFCWFKTWWREALQYRLTDFLYPLFFMRMQKSMTLWWVVWVGLTCWKSRWMRMRMDDPGDPGWWGSNPGGWGRSPLRGSTPSTSPAARPEASNHTWWQVSQQTLNVRLSAKINKSQHSILTPWSFSN